VNRVALKLVDTGLQFASSRGRLSRPSPGFALIDGRELAVGLDAERNARIKPRRLHSRFWQELGTAPLGRPFPGYLRTADLAHAHLKAVWDADGGRAEEVIVAVPGTYSDDQLALLLGIARELAIPIRGLVDVAVAASADRELPSSALHLDLHLHCAVLTELEHGDELVRKTVRTENRIGLLGLRDTWARVIAQTFVRATRFDPLHVAATEQMLYAQLADYLEVLAEKESTEVRIASGGRQHSIEIERSRIVDAAISAYDSVVSLLKNHENHDDTTLLLSHRTAALPGLVDHLNERTEFKVVVLHSAAAASGALAHADRIRSPESAVRFITNLPGLDARPPGPVTIPVRPPPDGGRHLPTHLVVNGVAHRIDSDPLMLGPSGVEDSAEVHHGSASVRRLAGQAVLDAPAEAGAILNGDPIEGRTALAPGDRLRFGEADSEVLVVAMAE
jgi:hypothetical protein